MYIYSVNMYTYKCIHVCTWISFSCSSTISHNQRCRKHVHIQCSLEYRIISPLQVEPLSKTRARQEELRLLQSTSSTL